jgi:pyruvate carboxylase
VIDLFLFNPLTLLFQNHITSHYITSYHIISYHIIFNINCCEIIIYIGEFLAPMQIGDEVTFVEKGQKFHVKLTDVKEYNASTQAIPVEYEINGKTYTVFIKTKPDTVPFIKRDLSKSKGNTTVAATKEKADKNSVGSVGATMPGKVVDIKVKVGDIVTKGTSMVVLSAMKMETIVRAPKDGKITRVVVKQDDNVSAGDLLVEVD